MSAVKPTNDRVGSAKQPRNLDPKATTMPEVAPQIRRNNFAEVEQGYTAVMAQAEARRCLGCKNPPCVTGCPVQVQIPRFVAQIEAGHYADAYDIIKENNSLPAICGRVCPQESQCEAQCVRKRNGEAVSIGRLERFAADWVMEAQKATPQPDGLQSSQPNEAFQVLSNASHKVAVIGSGPASLTCAADLAKQGCKVTIFEAFHVCGGVLVYGIPEFRLPKLIVEAELAALKELGVEFVTNMVIGRILSVDDLFVEMGFAAIFIGTGAGLPQFLGIPGESSLGVYSANEYLTRANLMKAYDSRSKTPLKRVKHIAVIGGGNVAMDAARTALRLGGDEVTVVYRRSFVEMPARLAEVHHAQAEGIKFQNLTNPLRIESDENGNVIGLVCEQMELGAPDASGRRSPVPIAQSEFCIPANAVIVAVGTKPNPLLAKTTDHLEADARGLLLVDDAGCTTHLGVFAGGDVVTGAATVISAMGAGKKAATAIYEYLIGKEKI